MPRVCDRPLWVEDVRLGPTGRPVTGKESRCEFTAQSKDLSSSLSPRRVIDRSQLPSTAPISHLRTEFYVYLACAIQLGGVNLLAELSDNFCSTIDSACMARCFTRTTFLVRTKGQTEEAARVSAVVKVKSSEEFRVTPCDAWAAIHESLEKLKWVEPALEQVAPRPCWRNANEASQCMLLNAKPCLVAIPGV